MRLRAYLLMPCDGRSTLDREMCYMCGVGVFREEVWGIRGVVGVGMI